MKNNPSPPRLFVRFFRWYCHPKVIGYIEGDLMEVYQRRYRESGKRFADLRFALDVIFLLRPAIVRPVGNSQPLNTYDMYSNYLKIAFRNLLKHKGYSTINILGLALGMSVALLIGLWVKFQASFNDFHVNGDNISIVMKRTFFNNTKGTQTGVMLPLYDELKAHYPEVKFATRLDWGDHNALVAGDTRISKRGHFADPDFLHMFTFPLVKGDIKTALKDPYSIVVTESLAVALFGDQDPMGKMVTLNKNQVVVTGVLKDVPPNSTLQFDFLAPYELRVLTVDWIREARDEWGNNFLQTYVMLNDGVTPEQFSARIEHLLQEKQNDKDEAAFFVHPLSRMHLHGGFKDWVNTGGAIELVRLFAIIGLLVLSIACINFINLSTARSEKRAREVGVRKAVGSYRRQLIGQFLSESMLTTFIAFLISLLIVRLSLPLMYSIGFEYISLDITDFKLMGIAIAACIVTGLLAGWYPALYLSGIKAVTVLKGGFRGGNAANLPRKVLVVSQFTFSIALIIATIVIFLQIEHARNRSLGYNPNLLINTYFNEDHIKHYDAMKEQLLATGYVEAVSRSTSPMTGVYNDWGGFTWEGLDPASHPAFSVLMVDHDYEKTAQLTINKGRFFDREHATDTVGVVLNEAAVKLIGFQDPVGKTMKHNDTRLLIIGVVQDIVMQNPFQEVAPAVYLLWPGSANQGLIRLREGANIENAIAAIKSAIEKINPDSPFSYQFTDDAFAGKFVNETRQGKLAAIFAVLSILISCLGLFGLASFMAERRTKEIGIRKVVGASMFNLWKMLSKDFVLLVFIACIVSIPASYFLMNTWLNSYAYRTDIPIWIPLTTGIGALVITLLTVSYQTIKAAKMNPVSSLRSE
ncbi:MAG TPA: ABC transporter permease [Cyclobacteriaceae bacterium]|nr:ABC transporter permease [Cyclobacteriaceae bacterium]